MSARISSGRVFFYVQHLLGIGHAMRAALLTRPANLHFWGILFSAGLLSLGAPFWYNALKGLSALKPIVADREQQERRTTMPQTPAG